MLYLSYKTTPMHCKMKAKKRKYSKGGKLYSEGGKLSNKQVRKNSRFQSKAERDRAMVARGAKSTKELMENLKDYDKKKEKGQIKKGLAAMAGAASLATYFGGKDMREARRRMRNRINVTG